MVEEERQRRRTTLNYLSVSGRSSVFANILTDVREVFASKYLLISELVNFPKCLYSSCFCKSKKRFTVLLFTLFIAFFCSEVSESVQKTFTEATFINQILKWGWQHFFSICSNYWMYVCFFEIKISYLLRPWAQDEPVYCWLFLSNFHFEGCMEQLFFIHQLLLLDFVSCILFSLQNVRK